MEGMSVSRRREERHDDIERRPAPPEFFDDRLRLFKLAHRRCMEPNPLRVRIKSAKLFRKLVEEALAAAKAFPDLRVKKCKDVKNEPAEGNAYTIIEETPEHPVRTE